MLFLFVVDFVEEIIIKILGLLLADLLNFEAGLREAIKRVDEQPDVRVPGSHCHWCNTSKCQTYQEYERSKFADEPLPDTLTI